MHQYLQALKNRLTKDEKRQLCDIYEPEVVAVPDRDA